MPAEDTENTPVNKSQNQLYCLDIVKINYA